MGSRQPPYMIGRQRELALVEDWFSEPSAPLRVLMISGIGGIGKTSFVETVAATARSRGAVTLWIDGQDCDGTPAQFLAQLRAHLMALRGCPVVVPDSDEEPSVSRLIQNQIELGRMVICIDNAEASSPLDGWFYRQWLQEMPDHNLMICMTSRSGPSLQWQRSAIARGCGRTIELRGLSLADCKSYLGHRNITNEITVQTIYRDTGGIPLGVALAADALARAPLNPEEALAPVNQIVTAELLRDLTTTDLHDALDALVIVREADQAMLSHIRGAQVTTPQFHALAALSFIRVAPHGLILHETVRTVLFSDLRRRNPQQFFEFHWRAMEALMHLRAYGTEAIRQRVATHLFALCADVCPSFTYSSESDETARGTLPRVEALQSNDFPVIESLLQSRRLDDGTCDPDQDAVIHSVLSICREFPEMVRVVRSATGEALGFHTCLLLYRDTADLPPERERGLLRAAMGQAFSSCYSRSAETADTRLMFSGWTRDDDPEFSRRVLFTALLVDWLQLSSEYVRGLAFAHNRAARPFFQRLGFKLLNEPTVSSQTASDLCVFDLDFRTQGLEGWIHEILRQTYPLSMHPLLVSLTPEDTRIALAALDNPDALEASVFARRAGLSSEEARAILLNYMTMTPPLKPLTPAQQRVLSATFVDIPRHYTLAMDRLHMSRTTYYRNLQDALCNLTTLLRNRPSNGLEGRAAKNVPYPRTP